MASDRLHVGSGKDSISADLIAQRGFATARRGYDPDEVRQFLSRVSDEVRFLRERLEHLEGARRDAEQRAAHPKLDEETLMVAVGEETATILRTARTAATDIRAKAEAYAAQVTKDVELETEELRAKAEGLLAQRSAEADIAAARIRDASLADAERARETARQEAAAIRQQADQERKLTVEAAQTVREKILTDLSRRRKVATVQIEQLRAGRERLLEAYGVVRRTLEEVTDELHRADAEARIAAETAGRRSEAELRAETEAVAPTRNAGTPAGQDEDAGPESGSGVVAADAAGPSARPESAQPDLVGEARSEPGATPGDLSATSTTPPSAEVPGAAADPGDDRSGGTGDDGSEATEGVRILRSPGVPQTPRSGRSRPMSRPGGPRMAQGGAAAAMAPDAPDPAGEESQPPVVLASVPAGEPAPGDVEVVAGAVDGLFARIRADREQAVAHAREVLGAGEPEGSAPGAVAAVAAVASDGNAGAVSDDGSVSEDLGPAAGDAEAPGDATVSNEDENWLQQRDAMIGDIESALARRLKRALQDEQNDLLDRLRSLDDKTTAVALLAERSDQQSRFVLVGRPLLEQAAQAGSAFGERLVGTSSRAADPPDLDDLANDLATAIVEPLRRRLENAFRDAGGDETALGESVGSAYREWKTQRIERLAADHVASSFARGAFAAVPAGTTLRWLVDDVDGPCPDCDDNALAAIQASGEPWPTGQLHPPAHAGCRCLLVPGSGR